MQAMKSGRKSRHYDVLESDYALLALEQFRLKGFFSSCYSRTVRSATVSKSLAYEATENLSLPIYFKKKVSQNQL